MASLDYYHLFCDLGDDQPDVARRNKLAKVRASEMFLIKSFVFDPERMETLYFNIDRFKDLIINLEKNKFYEAHHMFDLFLTCFSPRNPDYKPFVVPMLMVVECIFDNDVISPLEMVVIIHYATHCGNNDIKLILEYFKNTSMVRVSNYYSYITGFDFASNPYRIQIQDDDPSFNTSKLCALSCYRL